MVMGMEFVRKGTIEKSGAKSEKIANLSAIEMSSVIAKIESLRPGSVEQLNLENDVTNPEILKAKLDVILDDLRKIKDAMKDIANEK